MIIHTEDNILKVTEIGSDCELIPPFPLRDDVMLQVKYLDLSFNRIRSLTGLSGYTSLDTLVLDNNNLTDDLEIPDLPHLRVLSLNKNYICNLDNLIREVRQATPRLVYLSLLNNPACPNEIVNANFTEYDYRCYRLHVISQLPALRFLDSLKVSEIERKETTLMTSPETDIGPIDMACIERLYPSQTWKSSKADHHPTVKYGKVLYKSHGKHSEGNRFIRDRDL